MLFVDDAQYDAGYGSRHFSDSIWVSSLLHHFAAYYFDALKRYEEDRPTTPLAWRGAHQAAAVPSTPAHQNLLLGVNAHIEEVFIVHMGVGIK